tara:strand:- start:1816 stop:2403 length:588 start_codon:yes stop_codon:yes gene_type:complete
MPLTIDAGWVVICTVLVLLMQAGFICLETGLVRAKNSINVALKNISDFCIASLLFWAVGFGLMFGASDNGVIGMSGFFPSVGLNATANDVWLIAFFFFQLAFCSTAVTIFSGAVAERMSFRSFIIASVLLAAIIYPVTGHRSLGMGEPSQHGDARLAGSIGLHRFCWVHGRAFCRWMGRSCGRIGSGPAPRAFWS